MTTATPTPTPTPTTRRLRPGRPVNSPTTLVPASPQPTLRPTDARDALRRAAAKVAPVWSLQNYVAVNPYLGLVDRRFDDVAELLATIAGARRNRA